MTDPLRVLHISDYAHAGGAEHVAQTLVEIQNVMGMQSVLFAARDRLGPNRWELKRFVNLDAVRRLRAVLDAEQPDVIHFHNCYHAVSPAGEYQVLRYVRRRGEQGHRIAVVVSAHDFNNLCPSPTAQVFGPRRKPVDLSFADLPLSMGQLLSSRWDRRGRTASIARVSQFALRQTQANVLRRTDLVVCGSNLSAVAFRQVGLDTATIRLFVDIAPRGQLPTGPSPQSAGVVRAVYMGRLDDLKGVDRLLEGWPRETGYQLRIAGSGPMEAKLRGLVARRGLTTVTFVGELDRTGIARILAESDVLVAPTRWRETGGLVVLEAEAMGVPVIVPAGTALAEVSGQNPASVVVSSFDELTMRRTLGAFAGGAGRSEPQVAKTPLSYAEEVTACYDRILDEAAPGSLRAEHNEVQREQRPHDSNRLHPRDRMRVLSINDYSTSVGGAEVVWRRTHQLLLDNGVDSRLLAGDDLPSTRTPWSYVYSRPFARRVHEVTSQWKPDVVHLHNFHHLCSPSVLSALRDAKARGDIRTVIATAHDFHLMSPNPGLMRGAARAKSDLVDPGTRVGIREKATWSWDATARHRSFLRSAQHLIAYDVLKLDEVIDRVLCPSDFLASALSQVVETEVLSNPAPAPLSVEKDAVGLSAVFVGRIAPEKGLVPFLEMAPRSLLDRLQVIGWGEDEPAARQVVERRGLQTQFLGRVPRTQVLEVLETSHLVVLPSRCYENAPMAILEGLSRSANFLASDMGGIGEIARRIDGGFLFDPWSTASIELAVDRVWTAFNAGELNSIDASAYLSSCSEPHYIEGLMRCYEEECR